jgi:hypothetical protein
MLAWLQKYSQEQAEARSPDNFTSNRNTITRHTMLAYFLFEKKTRTPQQHKHSWFYWGTLEEKARFVREFGPADQAPALQVLTVTINLHG